VTRSKVQGKVLDGGHQVMTVYQSDGLEDVHQSLSPSFDAGF
jgi:hypothetical protein